MSTRIERALSQRMYLIARQDKSELEKVFTVLGSIGNVYEVRVRLYYSFAKSMSLDLVFKC